MKSVLLLLSVGQFLSLLYADTINANNKEDFADYVLEEKFECRYMNGTEEVRLLNRLFYNQEEYVYFDSKVGYYTAKTELGRADAEYFNKNKDIIAQMQAAVQTFCIHNYGVMENMGVTGRRVQPTMKISLVPHYEESHANFHLLMCSLSDFYPSEIEVKWYRNGQEETSQVESTEAYQNGDWTFQILVMLETAIEKDDVFTCEAHHRSLETPMRVDWHPQKSDSAKSKEASGIVGIVLGIVFVIVGVVVYMRGRKVQMSIRGRQAEPFIQTVDRSIGNGNA